jgi:hypothetical protein
MSFARSSKTCLSAAQQSAQFGAYELETLATREGDAYGCGTVCFRASN